MDVLGKSLLYDRRLTRGRRRIQRRVDKWKSQNRTLLSANLVYPKLIKCRPAASYALGRRSPMGRRVAADKLGDLIDSLRGFGNDAGVELEIMPHVRKLSVDDRDTVRRQDLGKTTRIVSQNFLGCSLDQRWRQTGEIRKQRGDERIVGRVALEISRKPHAEARHRRPAQVG